MTYAALPRRAGIVMVSDIVVLSAAFRESAADVRPGLVFGFVPQIAHVLHRAHR
jgi:hypothetical protein